MEKIVPFLQIQLTEWLALAEANSIFVGVIAGLVWLLTSMLYSIRIHGLKKSLSKSEQQAQQNQASLNDATLALEQAQSELLASVEAATEANAAKEQQQQRADQFQVQADQLQEQLVLRNQQLADTIKSLAISLDIGERPVPMTDDLQAEPIWQQHARVIQQLVTSLRSETTAKNEWQSKSQIEASKRAALEAEVLPLQTKLAEQSQRENELLAKINEQTVELNNLQQEIVEQSASHRTELQQSEQAFTQLIIGHQADAERLQALELQVKESSAEHVRIQQLQDILAGKESLITQLESQLNNALASKPSVVVEPPIVAAETKIVLPEANVTESNSDQPDTSSEDKPSHSSFGLLKGFFAKTTPAIATELEEEKPVAVAEPEPELPKIDQAPVVADVSQETAKNKALGFMKNVFEKAKSLEPDYKVAEPEPEPIKVEPAVVVEAVNPEQAEKANNLGFMKNIFSKKPILESAEPEVTTEKEAAVTAPGMAFMNTIFAKNTPPPEPPTPVAEPVSIETTSQKQPFSFIKKRFAKQEETTIVAEPVDISTPEAKPANLANQAKVFYRKFTSKK